MGSHGSANLKVTAIRIKRKNNFFSLNNALTEEEKSTRKAKCIWNVFVMAFYKPEFIRGMGSDGPSGSWLGREWHCNTKCIRVNPRQVSSQTAQRTGMVSAVANQGSETRNSYLRESLHISAWCIVDHMSFWLPERNMLCKVTHNKPVPEYVCLVWQNVCLLETMLPTQTYRNRVPSLLSESKIAFEIFKITRLSHHHQQPKAIHFGFFLSAFWS